MKVKINVDGCDDYTEVNIKCTEEQFAFLKVVARKVTKKSECVCQPTMSVKLV